MTRTPMLRPRFPDDLVPIVGLVKPRAHGGARITEESAARRVNLTGRSIRAARVRHLLEENGRGAFGGTYPGGMTIPEVLYEYHLRLPGEITLNQMRRLVNDLYVSGLICPADYEVLAEDKLKRHGRVLGEMKREGLGYKAEGDNPEQDYVVWAWGWREPCLKVEDFPKKCSFPHSHAGGHKYMTYVPDLPGRLELFETRDGKKAYRVRMDGV